MNKMFVGFFVIDSINRKYISLCNLVYNFVFLSGLIFLPQRHSKVSTKELKKMNTIDELFYRV